jgi:hypothetical protein
LKQSVAFFARDSLYTQFCAAAAVQPTQPVEFQIQSHSQTNGNWLRIGRNACCLGYRQQPGCLLLFLLLFYVYYLICDSVVTETNVTTVLKYLVCHNMAHDIFIGHQFRQLGKAFFMDGIGATLNSQPNPFRREEDNRVPIRSQSGIGNHKGDGGPVRLIGSNSQTYDKFAWHKKSPFVG